jgi:hypothetical protein
MKNRLKRCWMDLLDSFIILKFSFFIMRNNGLMARLLLRVRTVLGTKALKKKKKKKNGIDSDDNNYDDDEAE